MPIKPRTTKSTRIPKLAKQFTSIPIIYLLILIICSIATQDSIATNLPEPKPNKPTAPRYQTPIPTNTQPIQDPTNPEKTSSHILLLKKPVSSENPTEHKQHLTETHILKSAQKHYPEIIIAENRIKKAEYEITEARGQFDFNLKGGLASYTEGQYEGLSQYNFELKKTVPFANSSFSIGYYNTGGDYFPPTAEDYRTNKNGRLILEYSTSLMKELFYPKNATHLNISKKNKLYAKELKRVTQMKVTSDALKTYWKWAIYGKILQANQQILKLREQTYKVLQEQVNLGNKATIDLEYYQILLLEQKNTVQTSLSDYNYYANYLSLYHRDKAGNITPPNLEEVPLQIRQSILNNAVKNLDCIAKINIKCLEKGLKQRPDLKSARLKQNITDLEIKNAKNNILPELTFGIKTYQDFGNGYYNPGWNTAVKFSISVKLENRSAEGKLGKLKAKLIMQNQKIKLLQDKIKTEILSMHYALETSARIVLNNEENLQISERLFSTQKFRLQSEDITRYDLLAAEYSYYKAKINYLKSELQYKISLIDYLFSSAQINQISNVLSQNQDLIK